MSTRVRGLVEPVLAERTIEVVDVEHKGTILRVTVDRPGGIDLDGVSEATRIVSDEVDRHDVLPDRCILEVSSPGVERPLRLPEHFHRVIGSTIAVKTRAEVAGERRTEGVLKSADDDGIVVGDRRVAYADIDRARTVFTWGASATTRKAETAPDGAGAPSRRGGRGWAPARGKDMAR